MQLRVEGGSAGWWNRGWLGGGRHSRNGVVYAEENGQKVILSVIYLTYPTHRVHLQNFIVRTSYGTVREFANTTVHFEDRSE